MRYVRSFFFVLLLVAVVCTAVHAEPDFPADTAAGETVPVDATSTIPVVALDPDSVQAIADAVLPTEADNLDPTEATTPVVDLSPEAVAAIGKLWVMRWRFLMILRSWLILHLHFPADISLKLIVPWVLVSAFMFL